jgi:DnaJ homolog subfamily C member 13
LALEVISLLSRNKECVTEISACEILGQFLRIMKDDDFQKQRVLDTLSGLTNAPQLVKEAHSKGTLTWELRRMLMKGRKGTNELANECCFVEGADEK